MPNFFFSALCSVFLMTCSWFCLWAISLYFINDAILAMLFFPFALRLGVILHTPKRYWLLLYAIEWGLITLLGNDLNQEHWPYILILSILSLPLTWLASRFYKGPQWKKLSVIGVLITVIATLNIIVLSGLFAPLTHYWLASITGSLMLVPSCYLIWSYLFERVWVPLSPALISQTITLRGRHIAWYSLLFVLNIMVQIGLPDELRRFAPFCLAIPIILLAFRYGWQGALLGTLLNSIALIALSHDIHSNIQITDLLLSLLAQTLTGILLGLGVQHQRDLNKNLSTQLKRNHNLSHQLVEAEESIRRDIARELHDEIGQNITAIRTQANIIKRIEQGDLTTACASTIETLSLNVYDTTKGLLSQLRPKTLDDLGLKEAIEQLIRDMDFSRLGTEVSVNWQTSENAATDFHSISDLTQVTIYRICQEALNNIQKYANATQVNIDIRIQLKAITIAIDDNGIGFELKQPQERNFGLQGMQERVQVLGGTFAIVSSPTNNPTEQHGTKLYVQLPVQ